MHALAKYTNTPTRWSRKKKRRHKQNIETHLSFSCHATVEMKKKKKCWKNLNEISIFVKNCLQLQRLSTQSERVWETPNSAEFVFQSVLIVIYTHMYYCNLKLTVLRFLKQECVNHRLKLSWSPYVRFFVSCHLDRRRSSP